MDQPVYTLPLVERVRRYRELAEEALGKACTTNDQELRAEFLVMASDWQVLADGIEKHPWWPEGALLEGLGTSG